jgi:hypothetical protein
VSKYSSGYIAGVTAASNSTIDLDFIFQIGLRKANSEVPLINSVQAVPLIQTVKMTEYEDGWLEGVYGVFDSFSKGEIAIDTSDPNFIPLKVIKALITKSYKEQVIKIQTLNSKNSSNIKHEMIDKNAYHNYKKDLYSNNMSKRNKKEKVNSPHSDRW